MRKLSHRELRIERLEERTVLNGTVSIYLNTLNPSPHSGLLNIFSSDGAAHNLVIHQIGKTSAGATIQVQGIGTELMNYGTSKKSHTLSYEGVTDLDVQLGSGNDVLNFYNTTLDSVDITMGAGKDILTMSNITAFGQSNRTGVGVFVDLGNAEGPGDGADVASISNVNTPTGFILNTGAGGDIVTLNKVKVTSDNFIVEMGPGSHDVLTVTKCTAADAFFDDGNISNGSNGITPGTDGTIIGEGNQFAEQTIDLVGFVHRFGDLTKNEA